MSDAALSPDERAGWERDGFFLIRRFAPSETLDAMTARIVALARATERGESIGDAYVQVEARIAASAAHAEDKLSKLFRVHRDEPVFNAFCRDETLLDRVGDLLGTRDIDCFLSQFIFKLPGAMGQPWHQDAFYFPFDREPQVGLWLAVSEATERNGPLWVVPGSHRDPVHKVVRDRRPHANLGYVEIIDRDISGAQVVLMQPGDLLIFHSHLVHRSTDNRSDSRRAAMVYHYAMAGTLDGSLEKFGFRPPNIDWMPVRRERGAIG